MTQSRPAFLCCQTSQSVWLICVVLSPAPVKALTFIQYQQHVHSPDVGTLSSTHPCTATALRWQDSKSHLQTVGFQAWLDWWQPYYRFQLKTRRCRDRYSSRKLLMQKNSVPKLPLITGYSAMTPNPQSPSLKSSPSLLMRLSKGLLIQRTSKTLLWRSFAPSLIVTLIKEATFPSFNAKGHHHANIILSLNVEVILINSPYLMSPDEEELVWRTKWFLKATLQNSHSSHFFYLWWFQVKFSCAFSSDL